MTQSNLDPSRSSNPESSSPLNHDDFDRHRHTPNTSSDDKNQNGETHKHLRELKWSELISRQDAYRFYIKLILGVNAFFYATTGAVVLFYFDQPTGQYDREFFLLLPVLMGTVIGSFLIYATALQKHNGEILERLRVELNADYKMAIELIPDFKLLDRLLLVFGILFFIVAGSVNRVQWLRSGASLFSCVGLGTISAGMGVSWLARLFYLSRTKEVRTQFRPKLLVPDLLVLVDEMKKLDGTYGRK